MPIIGKKLLHLLCIVVRRVQEEHAVMAMTLNAADTMVLLNVANQGVHLWDIRE